MLKQTKQMLSETYLLACCNGPHGALEGPCWQLCASAARALQLALHLHLYVSDKQPGAFWFESSTVPLFELGQTGSRGVAAAEQQTVVTVFGCVNATRWGT
jgi:hypothetical protein